MYFYHGLMSFAVFKRWGAAGCDQPHAAGTAPPRECRYIYDDAERAVGSVDQQLLSARSRRLGTQQAWQRGRRSRWRRASGVASGPPEANFDPDHK